MILLCIIEKRRIFEIKIELKFDFNFKNTTCSNCASEDSNHLWFRWVNKSSCSFLKHWRVVLPNTMDLIRNEEKNFKKCICRETVSRYFSPFWINTVNQEICAIYWRLWKMAVNWNKMISVLKLELITATNEEVDSLHVPVIICVGYKHLIYPFPIIL